MADYDRYRQQAKFAQEQADRAKSASDKAAWLDLVKGWLSLLPKRARNAEEKFEERVRAEGTHQSVSDSEQ